jgi:hypothetical protein
VVLKMKTSEFKILTRSIPQARLPHPAGSGRTLQLSYESG